MTAHVKIYTDGACKGNPGVGGWGAVLQSAGRERELCGAVTHTTNNQMELTAAIRALEALTKPSQVSLYTDSTYVMKGITEWLPNWRRRGWKTASGTAVKNRELWQRLQQLVELHQIEWFWVKGHSGDIGNERADALANSAIDQQRSL